MTDIIGETISSIDTSEHYPYTTITFESGKAIRLKAGHDYTNHPPTIVVKMSDVTPEQQETQNTHPTYQYNHHSPNADDALWKDANWKPGTAIAGISDLLDDDTGRVVTITDKFNHVTHWRVKPKNRALQSKIQQEIKQYTHQSHIAATNIYKLLEEEGLV